MTKIKFVNIVKIGVDVYSIIHTKMAWKPFLKRFSTPLIYVIIVYFS